MLQDFRASFVLLVLFMLLLGVGYPFAMTGIGQSLLPYQANGSLVEKNGEIIGSTLIGQNFSDDRYFHPRPSAAGNGYDAGNSAGSNLYPTSADLTKTIGARASDLRRNGSHAAIPVDLVTASGSGLDPDISPAAALFQVDLVSTTRHLEPGILTKLIHDNTTQRFLGFIGENRVNVLALNQELDHLTPDTQ